MSDAAPLDITHPVVLGVLRLHPYAVMIRAEANDLLVDDSLSAQFDGGICVIDGPLSAESHAQVMVALRDGHTVLLAASREALLPDALDQFMLALLAPVGRA